MTWTLASELRQEVVERATANVAAMLFFNGANSDGVAAAVKSLEAQAYAKAEMASSVTTGERPHVEGVRMYTHDLGVLLTEALRSGAIAAPEASRGSGSATELSIADGNREPLTKDRAEALLEPLLAPGAQFTKVTLSTKSFGAESSEVARKALANNAATLVEADLSDIIAGRPEAEALASLTKVCSGLLTARLISLDLSDNALGEKGVRACADILKAQTALQSLAFQNDGISVHAASALLEILPAPQNLKRLHFYNNMTGDEGAFSIAQVLAKATGMEDFRMSSTRVMEQGGMVLAKAIAQGRSLIKLDLKDNSLGEEAGCALAYVLQAHPNLRHLNLSETALGNKGTVAIVTTLAASAPNLEVLELACNELTSSGAKKLAPALAQMKSLKKLVLSENEMGEKGSLVIARALSCCEALEELEVSECQIGRLGAVALAKCAASKSALKKLNLNGNMIPAEGVEEVQEIFSSAACGQDALGSLSENDEDGEGDDEDDEDDDADDDLSAALGGMKV
mmetsp:Transcript_10076/g.18988  ORF Transcript_10076/g.18988 Transcript_10076/m.18988 type:complete len:514 (-) Transcript_10076:111-1652(-)|eukprot:CAMPEP_0114249330 /NCGR_PEP_ID=MMETSP0058-20121206/14083_1 /TAXON_ID=36894 /ORGANISM="Pyramimonas parkeae, CCMP726" /LENGTH=513 /DNA_ID=CAMNT_0001362865 /DNA_START=37 /DNA_END=1581 /DNA_ORIENTATION=+